MNPLILTALAVVVLAVTAALVVPHIIHRTHVPALRSWFVIGAHDIRSTLPAAIRPIVQDGLVDRTFQDALIPEFLFPGVAGLRPWQANMGDTSHFTRTGLLTPQTTPLDGSDPDTDSYGIERYSMTMDQYGNALDTNMLQSAVALASKFLEDIQKLGINAGQSVNRIARNKLYAAYAGGRTWCTDAGSDDTSIIVDSVDGFTHVLVDGVPTPVSASNPLDVTIDGTANTVEGVDTGTNTLTLGTTRVDTEGDSVIADNAPTSFRPNARDTAFDLVAADVATFSLFRSAVARLRKQSVPTLGGAYVAHIDPDTEAQLFDDSEFRELSANGIASPVWGNLSLGRFGGIDWVRNNEARTRNNGTIDYHEPIVLGADSFLAGPMEGMGALLSEAESDGVPSAIEMVSVGLEGSPLQVARIIRPPQDRLQQVVGSAWSFVGDFAVPSDSVTGDDATFKRGVIVQHA